MTATLMLMDTMSGELKPVRAADGHRLRFYCCGPTLYDRAHIGNFRTFLVQDVFRRVAELSGLPTLHVRNVTNVEDKTIRRSQELGEDLAAFTARWKVAFDQDCRSLNMLSPHHEPGAVEHIAEQIALIETLMGKGMAYLGEDGSVYFRISEFPAYGRLSRLDARTLRSGEAHQSDEYDRESISDFALWKAAKSEDGPNHWESPWGPGRPGWHIECSAMSMKYLGPTLDLHSGGVDLVFPHHENEIAQSEGATGKPFTLHWFHVTHLMVDGAKMSKSLGNLYTLDDIKAMGFSAAEMRYVLIAGHYRKPLNFKRESLEAARLALKRLASVQALLDQAAGGPALATWDNLCGAEKTQDTLGHFAPAWEALLDNLNVPKALGEVFTACHEVERMSRDGSLPPEQAVVERQGLVLLLASLGLILPVPSPEADEAPGEVQQLAQQRWEAKQAKNWGEADRLRDLVVARGWRIKDRKDGFDLVRS
ncbi:MAG: cysteine--tRNA ligase [Kiritimatiellae bacterium]|nr:cysteine--tRNA ligase [Kiritimatiellia bacterium]